MGVYFSQTSAIFFLRDVDAFLIIRVSVIERCVCVRRELTLQCIYMN